MESILFRGISQKSIAKLYQAGHLLRMERGQPIVQKGELGEDFYIIVTGRVEVFDHFAGQERLLAALGPGECFGEMVLFSKGKRRSATVRCTDSGQLLAINEARLLKLADRDLYPMFHQNIVRVLANRLRHVNALYMNARYGGNPPPPQPQSTPPVPPQPP